MILFFYNLALLSGLLAGAPWWLWRMATTHKYREGLAERLGNVPAWIRSKAAERPVIWLHAVSVGEVLAVSRLVEELDRTANRSGNQSGDRSGAKFQVLISTTTCTGQKLARERFGANRVFYCPLDLPWAVRAHLNAIKPRMLVLAETEFWPNLLSGCFRRRIPVVVANARISDRSWPRYRMLRRLWRPILSRISRALAQTETDAERLKAIGVAAERVEVSGNLKFDVRVAQEADATRLLRMLGRDPRFFVAGSTLDGEEAALLEAWPKIAQRDPQLAMVLAPRHPERFAAVADLLQRSGLAWTKRSSWNGRAVESLEPGKTGQEIKPGQVILLDTIGELASIYSLAAVAFVGGSLFPSGGHNPLEPAQFGVPIVMGPHYANFRAMAEDLRAHDAMRIAAKEELAQTIADLLAHPAEAAAMGARAHQVFEAQAGATDHTAKTILELLAQQGRPA
jgi:3-deoxy-D-manno-octulosonic-acid transferase